MVRKRKMEADYLNTSGTAEEDYALCGSGFTSLKESPSAQTSSKRYVNMDSSRQSVTGYEWSCNFEADQFVDEKAIDLICNIARKLLTGADAETDYVQVDLDKSIAEKPNQFRARKRTVAVAVADLPDNDGEFGVTGDFLGVSDPIEGVFDTTTKTFTPDTPAVG